MKDRPTNETPDPTRESHGTCKFVGKALRPGFRAREIDVEALLNALEARNASRRAPERAVPRPHGVTGGVALAAVVAFRGRRK